MIRSAGLLRARRTASSNSHRVQFRGFAGRPFSTILSALGPVHRPADRLPPSLLQLQSFFYLPDGGRGEDNKTTPAEWTVGCETSNEKRPRGNTNGVARVATAANKTPSQIATGADFSATKALKRMHNRTKATGTQRSRLLDGHPFARMRIYFIDGNWRSFK